MDRVGADDRHRRRLGDRLQRRPAPPWGHGGLRPHQSARPGAPDVDGVPAAKPFPHGHHTRDVHPCRLHAGHRPRPPDPSRPPSTTSTLSAAASTSVPAWARAPRSPTCGPGSRIASARGRSTSRRREPVRPRRRGASARHRPSVEEYHVRGLDSSFLSHTTSSSARSRRLRGLARRLDGSEEHVGLAVVDISSCSVAINSAST